MLKILKKKWKLTRNSRIRIQMIQLKTMDGFNLRLERAKEKPLK